MWDLIVTIAIGLVVGLLARFIVPGKDSMGLIWTVLLGIGGSFLAGWVPPQIGIAIPGAGIGHFVASLIGAIVLVLIVRIIRR